jgi:hypothetical protein
MKKMIILSLVMLSSYAQAGLVCQESRIEFPNADVILTTKNVPFVNGKASFNKEINNEVMYEARAEAKTETVTIIIPGKDFMNDYHTFSSARKTVTVQILPNNGTSNYSLTCTVVK